MFRRLILAAVVGAAGALTIVGAAQAACPPDPQVPVKTGDTITYVCSSGGGDTTIPGTGDGGDNAQVCDLTVPGSLFNDFCIGTARCFINDPAAVQDTEENGLDESTKPNEDSHAVFWRCQRPDLTEFERYYWNDDQPTVTIRDRVIAATGALQLPTIQATFNPPTRTLVNLETWFWADGAPSGVIVGSEALGVRATATPRGLSIVPGDGSPSFACPMSVVKSDNCSYQFRRAGDYTATLSIVYDIRFEFGGQVLDLSTVPEEFRQITIDDDVPVTVREVQSRVTKVR